MSPPIAILGAGPSGLALARLLDLTHIEFVVFERDTSSKSAWGRGGSGTLDLHEGSGLLALEKAGLLDQFKAIARYDAPMVFADMHGEVLVRQGEGGATDRPEIDRKDLRVMLLGAVPKEKIRWGAKVSSVERESDGTMTVRFAEGGSAAGFKLVVGADGAWSRARSLVSAASAMCRRLAD
jgi:2-polyprenyl-6-methoxyphenol hydroxylase-like FAD-dependent oxidoreductase